NHVVELLPQRLLALRATVHGQRLDRRGAAKRGKVAAVAQLQCAFDIETALASLLGRVFVNAEVHCEIRLIELLAWRRMLRHPTAEHALLVQTLKARGR